MIVGKDNGAARVTALVAHAAKKAGHEVILVVEGQAGKRYFEAGLRPDFQGTLDFERQPFTFDCEASLQWSKADVVVTGISGPINLEQGMGLAANAAGIPLVIIQDFWGTYLRSKAKADAICVLDEFDAELAKKASPKHIMIAGNGGAYIVEVPFGLRKEIEDLRQRFGYVYTYIGGTEINTDAELRLIIECLKKGPGCVIARFHPNDASLPYPGGTTWGDHWRKVVEVLGDRSVTIQTEATTDQIAVASDLVLSGISTILTTTAYNGTSIAVCRTPETMKDFFNCTYGLEEIPHVGLGAPSFSEPTDLRDLLNPVPGLREKFIPFNPGRVLEVIETLLADKV